VAGRGYGYHPVARTAVRRACIAAPLTARPGRAAAGAYGYYCGNSGCYQNSYGAWVARAYPIEHRTTPCTAGWPMCLPVLETPARRGDAVSMIAARTAGVT
jgi:hypothetical protein